MAIKKEAKEKDWRDLEINGWKATVENWRDISKKAIPIGIIASIVFALMHFPFSWLLSAISFLAPLISWYLSHTLKEIKAWEQGVVLRVGKLIPDPKEAGWRMVWWPFEKIFFIKMYERPIDLPPQEVWLKEKAPTILATDKTIGQETKPMTATVDAILFYKVEKPVKSVQAVEDVRVAIQKIFQTTLRSKCSAYDFEKLNENKQVVSEDIKKEIDKQIDESWGVKVTRAEIQEIRLPQNVASAMNRIIESGKNLEAKMVDADADVRTMDITYAKLAKTPEYHQWRYLDAVKEFAKGNGSPVLVGGIKSAIGEIFGRGHFRPRPLKPRDRKSYPLK